MTISVSHCLLVNWAIILAFLSQQLRKTTPTTFTILCLDDSRVTNRVRRVASATTNVGIDRSSTDRWSFGPPLSPICRCKRRAYAERVTVCSRFDLETLVTRLSKEPVTFQQDNLWQATEETKRENEAGSEVERYAFYQPTTILISIISQY